MVVVCAAANNDYSRDPIIVTLCRANGFEQKRDGYFWRYWIEKQPGIIGPYSKHFELFCPLFFIGQVESKVSMNVCLTEVSHKVG